MLVNSAEAKEKLEEIFELYKNGFKKILCFYPSFDVKIKDIPYNYTYQKFKKAVNDKLNNYQNLSTDKYIMSKYKDGYFDSYPFDETNEIYHEFVRNNEILLSPIVSLLPDYYA